MTSRQGTGQGSVRQLGPGRWEIRLSLGKDPASGRYRQHSKTFHGTERQALAAARRFREHLAVADESVSTITVAELLDRHLDALAVEGRSPTTLAGYRWRARTVISPAIGHIRIGELAVHDLDRLYAAELARGVSSSTIHQTHSVISGALTRAAKKGWLGDRPVNVARNATVPSIGKRRPRPPSSETIEALAAAAERAEPRQGLYVRLAATTGLRRGELCGLRWSDLAGDSILVARNVIAASAEDVADAAYPSRRHVARPRYMIVKSLKRDKPRRIALDADTILALSVARGQAEVLAEACETALNSDGYIFSDDPDAARPWHPDDVSAFVMRAKRAAGITDRRLLHGLRHYNATELLAAGFDAETVAHRLGNTPSMVLDVYGHHVEARDQAAADLLGGLFRRSEPERPERQKP